MRKLRDFKAAEKELESAGFSCKLFQLKHGKFIVEMGANYPDEMHHVFYSLRKSNESIFSFEFDEICAEFGTNKNHIILQSEINGGIIEYKDTPSLQGETRFPTAGFLN